MGATGRFVIVPAYYQTWWFRLFYIALAFGALWLLYLYRLQQAKAQIQERLGAQMEERERIARELHDTLLQGFQGLMLRLQGVIKTLPQREPAYQMMEKVLDRADEVLQEGRQRVRELRAEGMSGNDLIEALTESGEELAQGHDAHFSLTVVGTPQTLNPIVCNEAYRIAQEAISNAFRHSNGSEIDVEVTYSSERLTLRVCDNGKGMSGDILASGRAGHWGLSGMRERAQKIAAQLSIWSRPGTGTEVDLSIPSKVAYLQSNRELLWKRLLHRIRM
jgi:signal transduction histidine kinase